MSSTSDCDAAATAKRHTHRHRRCEAGPLPPSAVVSNVVLHEMYYDDVNTSYLGFVDDGNASVCSDTASNVSHDDTDFDDRLHLLPKQASASPVTVQRPLPRPAARRRHNPYEVRVMPDWAYQHICPPPLLAAEIDQPMTEVAFGDTAPMIDVAENTEMVAIPMPATMQPDGFMLGDDSAATSEYIVDEAAALEYYNNQDAGMTAMHQPRNVAYLGRPRGQPMDMTTQAAAAPAGAMLGVMCCYFKQGHCSMGASCWYRHEGAPDTPCHYGASCRKGHRHLVRSNQTPPVPKQPDATAAMVAGAAGVPRRYVHEAKPPRPSAPLLEWEHPCPHCGEMGVRTQDFPLYEGNRVRQATRAHCSACRRTFMVA